MELSQVNKYKLQKVKRVFLWTILPYILIKVPQELLGLQEFAEYSFLLNLLAYIGKTIKEEPTKTEMRMEGIK